MSFITIFHCLSCLISSSGNWGWQETELESLELQIIFNNLAAGGQRVSSSHQDDDLPRHQPLEVLPGDHGRQRVVVIWRKEERKKNPQARCYTAAVMTQAASAISASWPGPARLASPSATCVYLRANVLPVFTAAAASKLINAYLSCCLKPVSAVTAVTPVASTVQGLVTAHILASGTFFLASAIVCWVFFNTCSNRSWIKSNRKKHSIPRR